MVRCQDIENEASLLAYLRQTGRIGEEEAPGLQILAGGVSNRTVLMQRTNGQAWVLKQALPKLRVEVDWFSDPARIVREALALQWLGKWLPKEHTVPLVFLDRQNHILAMQAVPYPHQNWKTLLLDGRLIHHHVHQFARLLAIIHRRALEDREDAAKDFADRSFFQSLRLEPYYAYTGEQEAGAKVFLRRLITETLQREDTVVHGDYSPKNILVHGGNLIPLDHEVMHWGDPAFDIGFSLTHFLSKANHLAPRRMDFARAAQNFWMTYGLHLGPVPWLEGFEARCVKHTLACLLARVRGRSPLEYLNAGEADRQRETVLQLMQDSPGSMEALVNQFTQNL